MTDARLPEGTHPFGDGSDDIRTLQLRRLDPAGDAALVQSWVRDERARFWGMLGHTEQQVRDVYAFVDSLDTHHAYLVSVLGPDGARPVALFQTYEPAADPVAEVYDVADGDFGIHLLLAPATAPEPGFTDRLLAALAAIVLTNPDVRRVVVEPDAGNDRALDRAQRTGFALGPEVDLETKRARLAFLDRADVEALVAAAQLPAISR